MKFVQRRKRFEERTMWSLKRGGWVTEHSQNLPIRGDFNWALS